MTPYDSTVPFPPGCQAFRGPLLHCLADPGLGTPEPGSVEYLPDGLLVVHDGRVVGIGPADELLDQLPPYTKTEHWPDALIVPGFIDTHVHMPQLGVMASYGSQLLEWLERYTFPTESRFADPEWAAQQAQIFINLLLAHGTTSALVFSTSHLEATDFLFAAAHRYGMALTTGKVMMDRHAPDALRDTAVDSYTDSQRLIERWHGRGRLRYAVTPRFAGTSTPLQMELAADLMREHPSVLMQTHWAENTAEIAWIQELFPDHADYLDVYDQFGLLGERSVLAHGIHISDENRRRLADTGTRIAFCPTSNTFLGSGLFNFKRARETGVQVGLASDVGGGTSLSMLTTMAEAYKVCQLQGQSLNPLQAFYLATLGNAKVLHQEAEIGNLAVGKYADFLVLNRTATPMLDFKKDSAQDLKDLLFNLMVLGDDRVIQRTYIAGQCRYNQTAVRGTPSHACLSH